MRRGAVVLLTALSLLGPLGPQPAEARRDLGAVGGNVALVPIGDNTLSVGGLHSYFGTLRVRSTPSGLVVVDSLPLERYLLGLNEVPTTWPVEALRAQAVAARTYALHTMAQPPGGDAATYGFDICATVACQVFSGADVLSLPSGARWGQAVRDTKSVAILYDGEPILARYHSTSGGQTFDNEDVFDTEPAYPYLQAVESTTEEGSPLYRWRVRFRLAHLERLAEAAGLLPAAGRLTDAHTVSSREALIYPDVLLTTTRADRRVTAEELRVGLRTLAPALYPALYPSPADTTSGRLPETFPSNRFEMATNGRTVEVLGRGWGHGVGMSQWGAEGLARRGASYPDILQHYYTGVSIATVPTPHRIDVGVSTGVAQVQVTGAFKVVSTGGRTLVKEALGTWTFPSAGDGVVAVDPPRGYGLPLNIDVVRARRRIGPGERGSVTFALSRPARVRTVVEGSDRRSSFEVSGAGRDRLAWRAPAEPGRYTLHVVARAGGKTKKDSIGIRVASEEQPQPQAQEPSRPPREPHSGPPWGWIWAGIIVGGALILWVTKVTMSE